MRDTRKLEILYTHRSPSSTKMLLECPRKWRNHYLEGYQEVGDKPALLGGTLFHLGAEAYWRGLDLDHAEFILWWSRDEELFWATSEGSLEFIRILAYLRGYYAKYREIDRESLGRVVEIEGKGGFKEDSFIWPMSHHAEWTGRLDVLLKNESGDYVIIDHKTSNAAIAKDLSGPYWRALAIDPQVCIYAESVKRRYNLSYIPEVIFDVVLKSTNKHVLKKVVRKRKEETDDDFSKRKLANLENLETDEELQDKLDKKYREKGGELLIRRGVVNTWDKLSERLNEFNVVYELALNPETGYSWMRNTTSCFNFNSVCVYLENCRGTGTLEGNPRLKKVNRVRPEPQGDDEDDIY